MRCPIQSGAARAILQISRPIHPPAFKDQDVPICSSTAASQGRPDRRSGAAPRRWLRLQLCHEALRHSEGSVRLRRHGPLRPADGQAEPITAPN